MAGHDQCRSTRRRPPKRRRRGGTGMQIFRGDRSTRKQCACDGPLEYRNRTSSNPSGIFSHRSGISTSLVTGTRPGGRRTCFWTAPGARLCRPPWEGRTAIAEGCPAHLRRRAGASFQGASTATSTSRSERVYRLRSRLSCCWRQPCCVIAASWRPLLKAL